MKRKEYIQYVTAIVTLALGHALVIADFVLSATNTIHDQSLMYFGQCCIFCGSVFGVVGYVNAKFNSYEHRHPEIKEDKSNS